VLSRSNLSYPSRRSSPKSRPFNLLQPLHSLFTAPVVCFQQLAASFSKTPGVGVPQLFGAIIPRNANLPIGARFRVPNAAHSAKGCKKIETATTFRINTCKSVSKQSTLTPFRMNTYEKTGEGGIPFAIRHLSSIQLPASIPMPLRLCFHLCALGASMASSSSFSELTLELNSNAYANRRF
jgi:hypothetical protein